MGATQEHLHTTHCVERVGSYSMQKCRPRVVCADGFSMSVQASGATYCSPRETGDIEYSAVEIGYPSEKVDEFMEWAEDEERPTDTVYGYVPIEVVDAVIAKHGGVKGS